MSLGRGGLVLALAMLACLGAIAPAVGGVPLGNLDGNTFAAAETPTANETVHHENPDDANQDGNLQDVQGWLLGRISGNLEESALEISRGQYDAAQGLLGNETRDALSRFVEVAEETSSEADDRAAERLNETVKNQREFAETVSNYSHTYEAYLDARENGETERARQLARELLAHDRRLNQTGQRLQATYAIIENATGVDTSTERETIEERTRNVSETTDDIRAALFVETEITISEASTTASFTEPLVVRGRVTTVNGTGISNTTVAIRESRQAATTTASNGSFILQYRPVSLPADADEVSVDHIPDSNSTFLGATTSVPVSIDQVASTLTLNGVPDRIAFGEEVTLEATVDVQNRPVDAVPVVALLGGQRVASGMTTNGSTHLSFSVPAAIEDGEHDLTVALAMTDRAVAASSATATVRVSETPTILEIEANQLSDGDLHVTGQLTTVDGDPIPDRVVDISIGGQSVGGDLTDAAGNVSTVLSVPDGVGLLQGGNLTVNVTGSFDGAGTNFGSTMAGTQVLLGPAHGGTFGFGVPGWAWAGLLGLVLVVAVVTYRVLSGEEDDTVQPAETAVGSREGAGEATTDTAPLRELARSRLSSGATDDAVQVAYGAARRALSNRFDVEGTTHWDFYRACTEAGVSGDRQTALRRLTEHYERAAFAPESLSIELANEALGLVDAVDPTESSTG